MCCAVRERNVDELCGRNEKGVETIEYAAKELMKKQVH